MLALYCTKNCYIDGVYYEEGLTYEVSREQSAKLLRSGHFQDQSPPQPAKPTKQTTKAE